MQVDSQSVTYVISKTILSNQIFVYVNTPKGHFGLPGEHYIPQHVPFPLNIPKEKFYDQGWSIRAWTLDQREIPYLIKTLKAAPIVIIDLFEWIEEQNKVGADANHK